MVKADTSLNLKQIPFNISTIAIQSANSTTYILDIIQSSNQTSLNQPIQQGHDSDISLDHDEINMFLIVRIQKARIQDKYLMLACLNRNYVQPNTTIIQKHTSPSKKQEEESLSEQQNNLKNSECEISDLFAFQEQKNEHILFIKKSLLLENQEQLYLTLYFLQSKQQHHSFIITTYFSQELPCHNNCSGNGTCNSATGICLCDEYFANTDCLSPMQPLSFPNNQYLTSIRVYPNHQSQFFLLHLPELIGHDEEFKKNNIITLQLSLSGHNENDHLTITIIPELINQFEVKEEKDERQGKASSIYLSNTNSIQKINDLFTVYNPLSLKWPYPFILKVSSNQIMQPCTLQISFIQKVKNQESFYYLICLCVVISITIGSGIIGIIKLLNYIFGKLSLTNSPFNQRNNHHLRSPHSFHNQIIISVQQKLNSQTFTKLLSIKKLLLFDQIMPLQPYHPFLSDLCIPQEQLQGRSKENKQGQTMPKYKQCCAICLAEFEQHESIRKTICNHIFHPMCLSEWLIKNENCPLCRQGLDMVAMIDRLTKLSRDNPFIKMKQRSKIAIQRGLLTQMIQKQDSQLTDMSDQEFLNLFKIFFIEEEEEQCQKEQVEILNHFTYSSNAQTAHSSPINKENTMNFIQKLESTISDRPKVLAIEQHQLISNPPENNKESETYKEVYQGQEKVFNPLSLKDLQKQIAEIDQKQCFNLAVQKNESRERKNIDKEVDNHFSKSKMSSILEYSSSFNMLNKSESQLWRQNQNNIIKMKQDRPILRSQRENYKQQQQHEHIINKQKENILQQKEGGKDKENVDHDVDEQQNFN